VRLTFSDLKAENPGFFSEDNRRFFGDIAYEIWYSLKNIPYLVQETYGFTDMFGEKRRHFRLRRLGETPENRLGYPVLDREFKSADEVYDYLEEH